ncbi:ATP-binding protein [Streptomyces atroolivaceus]|uniref:ATP-binding protein n=1 Tax=Streptomyces atroolivaceus TaxID=66869 RepID=UPI00362E6C30
MSEQDTDHRLRSVLPFRAEPAVVRGLRAMVGGQLAEWGLSAVIEGAELVVSELATNVIKHVGRGEAATLVVEVAGGRVRVELHDCSRLLPVPTTATHEDEGGRGMSLLAAVGADWGAVLTATGKAVWCELSADPEAPCRRLRRAEAVLATYRRDAEAMPLLERHTSRMLEESATDLIVDLLHWITARGGDSDALLDRAQMRFEAEWAPEDSPEAA